MTTPVEMSTVPAQTIHVQAILFDMDGTLVDSTAEVEVMWTEFAAANGVEAQTVIDFAHGRPSRDTIAKFAPHEIERWETFIHDGEHTRFLTVRQIPGAVDLVNSLRPGSWALVTSALHHPARQRLRVIGIEPPEVVIGAEDVTSGKPDPEGYLAAASALGVAPQDCVVFEDTDAGVRAGLAAGCTVVVVGDQESPATAELIRIDDFSKVRATPDAQGIGISLL
jgi:sugar-phosphatase